VPDGTRAVSGEVEYATPGRTAVGPVAWSLARVATGRADGTWSRSWKAEWEVAAGAALVAAAGGFVSARAGTALRFNRWPPRVPGLIATGHGLAAAVQALVDGRGRDRDGRS
jgi:myo-inositol-1(or 4)-monophosphatase